MDEKVHQDASEMVQNEGEYTGSDCAISTIVDALTHVLAFQLPTVRNFFNAMQLYPLNSWGLDHQDFSNSYTRASFLAKPCLGKQSSSTWSNKSCEPLEMALDLTSKSLSCSEADQPHNTTKRNALPEQLSPYQYTLEHSTPDLTTGDNQLSFSISCLKETGPEISTKTNNTSLTADSAYFGIPEDASSSTFISLSPEPISTKNDACIPKDFSSNQYNTSFYQQQFSAIYGAAQKPPGLHQFNIANQSWNCFTDCQRPVHFLTQLSSSNTPLQTQFGEAQPLQSYSPPLNFSAFQLDQNMICPICRKCFRFEKNLLRHLQKTHATGTGESVLKCKLCNYTTRHYSNMYVHIRTHTGDKPYSCSACGVSFTQGSSLKLHIKSRHQDNGKYFSLTRKPGKNNLTKLWTRVLKKDLPKYNNEAYRQSSNGQYLKFHTQHQIGSTVPSFSKQRQFEPPLANNRLKSSPGSYDLLYQRERTTWPSTSSSFFQHFPLWGCTKHVKHKTDQLICSPVSDISKCNLHSAERQISNFDRSMDSNSCFSMTEYMPMSNRWNFNSSEMQIMTPQRIVSPKAALFHSTFHDTNRWRSIVGGKRLSRSPDDRKESVSDSMFEAIAKVGMLKKQDLKSIDKGQSVEHLMKITTSLENKLADRSGDFVFMKSSSVIDNGLQHMSPILSIPDIKPTSKPKADPRSGNATSDVTNSLPFSIAALKLRVQDTIVDQN